MLLLWFGLFRYGQMGVGNPHVLADVTVIRMIGHDDAEVHGEFAAAPPRQQVIEAVRLLGCHDRRRNGDRRVPEINVHLELLSDDLKGVEKSLVGDVGASKVKLDALKEDRDVISGQSVHVLLGVDDVAIEAGNERRGRSDDALLVGTRQKQDARHCCFLSTYSGFRRATPSKPLQ